MIVSSKLRLSAQRAFLGRIRPEMRLVKIKLIGDNIHLSVVLSREPTDRIRDDVSSAAAEIIADFPAAKKIEESLQVNTGPVLAEDVLAEGWIFRRAESDRAQ
ncbi:MAG TPA: hypothetical protein VFG91_12840 [Woeseiaceae bacterium]|nr:hypothetical protein [Woeseiaceae bacterium]